MPRLAAEASPELKRARALLALMPKLDEARWTKALKTLYRSERIEGPRAVSWLLNVLASQAPGGQDRLWLSAAPSGQGLAAVRGGRPLVGGP